MSADSHSHDQNMSPRKLFYLALGSVGVVYGDIGTSPLYAFREALKPVAADGPSPVPRSSASSRS